MERSINALDQEIDRAKWEIQEFRAATKERQSLHSLEKNEAEEHLKLQRERFESFFSNNFSGVRYNEHYEKNLKKNQKQQQQQMQGIGWSGRSVQRSLLPPVLLDQKQQQQQMQGISWSDRSVQRSLLPPVLLDLEVQRIHVACMTKARRNSPGFAIERTTDMTATVMALETEVLCGIHKFLMAESQLEFMGDELKQMVEWAVQKVDQLNDINHVVLTNSVQKIISMYHEIQDLSQQLAEKLEAQHDEMKQIHESILQNERNEWRQLSLDVPSVLQPDERLNSLVSRLEQKCAVYKHDEDIDDEQFVTSKSEKPYRRRNSLWDSIVNTTNTTTNFKKVNSNININKDICTRNSRRASLGDTGVFTTSNYQKQKQLSRRGSNGSSTLGRPWYLLSSDHQKNHSDHHLPQQQQRLSEKHPEIADCKNEAISAGHRRVSLGWTWTHNEEIKEISHKSRNEDQDDKIGDYEALLQEQEQQQQQQQQRIDEKHPKIASFNDYKNEANKARHRRMSMV